jgi:hypothetical protein
MSFVITMYAREGIVMASDSRLTLNSEQQQGDKHLVHVAVGVTDSNERIFLLPNHIGIATYGAAEIKGIPINVYLEAFVQEHLSASENNINDIATNLLAYFRQFPAPPATHFHIAGYNRRDGRIVADDEDEADEGGDDDPPKEFREYFRQIDPDPTPHTHSHVSGYKPESRQKAQRVLHIDVARNHIGHLNATKQPGVSWGGEADVLARLLQPVGIVEPSSGTVRQVLPHFPIPWQFFTLQDAIDFCVFAVRTTRETIRFQTRPKTVGGPVDVLVITPERSFWVQRKELHG